MLGVIGDIGGTNSRFALVRGGEIQTDHLINFRNDEFDTFEAVLRAYLSRIDGRNVQAVCVGCAGPLRDGFVRLTNRPWFISEGAIAQISQASQVTLLNDLQAQGYALHDIHPSEMQAVCAADIMPENGTRMSVSVGTGLNTAVSYMQADRVFVPPAESGFMPLQVQDADDLKLLTYLQERVGVVSSEAVLSGVGLARLWTYFGGPGDAHGAQVIQAYEASDPAAVAAMRLFTSVLARYCAALTLSYLPRGGLILASSVARAVGPYLSELRFQETFLANDRGAEVLHKIPVWIAPDRELGLNGCARYLRQMGS